MLRNWPTGDFPDSHSGYLRWINAFRLGLGLRESVCRLLPYCVDTAGARHSHLIIFDLLWCLNLFFDRETSKKKNVPWRFFVKHSGLYSTSFFHTNQNGAFKWTGSSKVTLCYTAGSGTEKKGMCRNTAGRPCHWSSSCGLITAALWRANHITDKIERFLH